MNKIFTVLRKQQRIVVVPGRAIIRLLLSVIVVQQVLFPNHDNYMNVFLFALADEEAVGLVKMCLFYPNESGHARTDPILNPTSPSDHVHTFYGPQNFHPSTTSENLLKTKPEYSSSPFVENQSLYWHPSIYRVTTDENEVKTYTRVNNLDTSPYYRWNTNTLPETVPFPPGFRMISHSDQYGITAPSDFNEMLFVECCDYDADGEEICSYTSTDTSLIFPQQSCDFLSIALRMPTCWDESKGIGTNDPFSHVAYTVDGSVSGECPAGFNKRIPEVQLFVRINDYQGGTYQLSNDSDTFHVDFMSGWKEGALENILANCAPFGDPGYNPPCGCDEFLVETANPAKPVCDVDVREHIVDEATDVVTVLPRSFNSDAEMIPKTWDVDPPFDCESSGPGIDCHDSPLTFNFKKEPRTCSELDATSTLCNKKRIKSHCPAACEADWWCSKDSKGRFRLANNGKFKRCKWVARRPNKRCQKTGICDTCKLTCKNVDACISFS